VKNAIAIWNYCWNPEPALGWIRDFANAGFDAVSFHPNQFLGDAARHLPAVAELMGSLDLSVTVHSPLAVERPLVQSIVNAFGNRLLAFTFDSVQAENSLGRVHDAGQIAGMLAYMQSLTAGTAIHLAVEDFPLDAAAMKHFGDELRGAYAHPRTGILIDVGHMNIRRKTSDYFGRLSVGEYFRQLPCPLVEIHLHDNDGTKDQHGHFGMGNIAFNEVAQALRALRFDGVCTIEVAPSLHASTPEASKDKAVDSLRQWRELMR
jgi:sugar phosphate isomerase/epimerase